MAYNDFKLEGAAAVLNAMAKTATIARHSYTDLTGRANVGEAQDELRFTYVQKPGDPSDLTHSVSTPALSTATTHKVTMRLTNWKNYLVDFSDKDLSETGGRVVMPVLSQYGSAMGSYMEKTIFEAARDGSGFWNGVAGTTPFRTDASVARRARRQLVERDAWDSGSYYGYVNPEAAENLLGLEEFVTQNKGAGAQGEATLRSGQIDMGTRYGIRWFESNNIVAAVRSKGSVTTNGAVAKGAQSFAVDSAAGTGIRPGELFTTGTGTNARSYSIVTGISGTSGTITVDRPVEVAIADNATLTFQAAHDCNFVLDPQAIAFAMRPTAAPGVSADGRIVSLVDQRQNGTGFSVKLEWQRTPNGSGWRALISALWGVRVMRPEQVQRVLG